jgi:hypothetical protein
MALYWMYKRKPPILWAYQRTGRPQWSNSLSRFKRNWDGTGPGRSDHAQESSLESFGKHTHFVGLCNKVPQPWWLEAIGTCHLTDLEAWELKCKCLPFLVPPSPKL